MTHDRSLTRHFAAPLVLMLLVGCQDETESLPELAVMIPDQFEDGGSVWEKQSTLQQSDKECLSAFFARNGDLAGSPEFEGQPTVFVTGKSDRRFYWLKPSAEGVRWLSVEFRNHRFSAINGTGSPFE